MNACKNCKFLLNKSHRKIPMWYDLFCTKSPKEPEWNPFEGKHINNGYNYIREVNDCIHGYNCDVFKKKKGE